MIKKKRGFTLIELLIVVLIIGILTAVAVPMYKRAVLKSQFSTLLPLAKNLWEGNEIFYLNNGEYAASVDELDVSAPADPKVQATLGDEAQHQYVRVSKTDIPNRITMYQKHSPNFPEETHCEALLNNDPANWLCKDGLQGTFVGNREGHAVYSLSPESVGSLLRNYENANNVVLEAGESCTASAAGGCYKVNATGGSCVVQASNYNGPSCRNGTFTDGATCESPTSTSYACAGSSFSNNSTCRGYSTYGCYFAKFNHSTCEVIYDPQDRYSGAYGCANATFTNYSVCTGNKGCSGTFTDHSVCRANTKGMCGATYDDTSYCEGNFCPTGSPSSDSSKIWYRGTGDDWPDSRPSELVDK